jgi:hypothetical protein
LAAIHQHYTVDKDFGTTPAEDSRDVVPIPVVDRSGDTVVVIARPTEGVYQDGTIATITTDLPSLPAFTALTDVGFPIPVRPFFGPEGDGEGTARIEDCLALAVVYIDVLVPSIEVYCLA